MYTCFRCWPIVFVSSSFGQKSAACWDVGASCAATSLSYLWKAPSPGLSTPPPEFPPFFGYPAATSTASNSCYSSCVFRSLASLSQIHSHTHRYVLANTHTHSQPGCCLTCCLARSYWPLWQCYLRFLRWARKCWQPTKVEHLRGVFHENGGGAPCVFPTAKGKSPASGKCYSLWFVHIYKAIHLKPRINALLLYL